VSTFVVHTREQSLNNLRIAFNAESNAVARYHAFAMQADEEACWKAGSLFRAMARSEEIHAANHAALLREMGIHPRCAIEVFQLKGTAENLQTALAGEMHELKHVYPAFLREAEAARMLGLRRSFRFALLCEMKHARLLRTMLKQIGRAEGALAPQSSAYYVCPECGFIVDHVAFTDCPICGHCRQDFEWWRGIAETGPSRIPAHVAC
jgi:rubrerythrin